jgi:uncharacterized membrane protein YdjX (TVP38/TMEM64 family)
LKSLRLAAGLAIGFACVAGAGFALSAPSQALELSRRLGDAARDAGPLGVLLFGAAQALVALSGVLPAALLGVAAGAVYGLKAGFALAAFSTLTGAWLTFALARSTLGGAARRFLESRPAAREFDEAVAREGWRFVCLVRLSPVMPFSATSFALGLTRVGARDYLLGTLGSMPALLGYVGTGALCEQGLAPGVGWWRFAGLGLGIAATAILTLRAGKLIKGLYSFSQY